MANAEREAITGVRGAETPVGGSGGQSPLKLNALLFSCVQRKLQICPIIDICKSQ